MIMEHAFVALFIIVIVHHFKIALEMGRLLPTQS